LARLSQATGNPESIVSFAMFQNVQPKGTPGVSQDSSPPPTPAQGGGQPPPNMLFTFLPLLIFVPILFMMFRRQKKEADQRSKLKKGDRVVSNSGLIGELMEMDDRVAKVKIAPGTTVQMLTTSVSPFNPDAGKESATKELKDAKAVTDKK
jgi:preprotein translocase subunit YajC